jgi:hypothetical protein
MCTGIVLYTGLFGHMTFDAASCTLIGSLSLFHLSIELRVTGQVKVKSTVSNCPGSGAGSGSRNAKCHMSKAVLWIRNYLFRIELWKSSDPVPDPDLDHI